MTLIPPEDQVTPYDAAEILAQVAEISGKGCTGITILLMTALVLHLRLTLRPEVLSECFDRMPEGAHEINQDLDTVWAELPKELVEQHRADMAAH